MQYIEESFKYMTHITTRTFNTYLSSHTHINSHIYIYIYIEALRAHLEELLVPYGVPVPRALLATCGARIRRPASSGCFGYLLMGYRAAAQTQLVQPHLRLLCPHLLRDGLLSAAARGHVDIVIEYILQRTAEFVCHELACVFVGGTEVHVHRNASTREKKYVFQ